MYSFEGGDMLNYGKRGTKRRRKQISSPMPKFGNFFCTLLFKAAVLAFCCAAAAGLCYNDRSKQNDKGKTLEDIVMTVQAAIKSV